MPRGGPRIGMDDAARTFGSFAVLVGEPVPKRAWPEDVRMAFDVLKFYDPEGGEPLALAAVMFYLTTQEEDA